MNLTNIEKRKARVHAVLMMYQHDISGFSPDRVISEYWDENDEKEEVKKFAERLFLGALKHRKLVDLSIARFLKKGWTIKRLLPMDRAVLRVLGYEVMYERVSPVGAVINDAVEIAKRYGEEKSAAFVNALLDRVARSG